MVVEEQCHVDRVADVDKITLLATVLVIGPVRLEQFNPAGFLYLGVGLLYQRTHGALVVLPWAVDVEVLEAHDRIQQTILQRPQVEHLFRLSVKIEGFE